jgi:hypothetical protein
MYTLVPKRITSTIPRAAKPSFVGLKNLSTFEGVKCCINASIWKYKGIGDNLLSVEGEVREGTAGIKEKRIQLKIKCRNVYSDLVLNQEGDT